MANVRLANAAQQAAMDAVVDLIDSGGAGTINIYSGTQPTTANDAVGAGTLLATLTFNVTAFGATNTSGVATAAAITGDSSADATGMAAWARVLNGSAATVFDCDVTATDGGGTIELNTISIVAGGSVDIGNFMTMTHPDGT
jgi:hypothetical protein